MDYGRRIGVEVRCDVVEDEFGGGAENVFDGAKGVPITCLRKSGWVQTQCGIALGRRTVDGGGERR